MKKRACIPGRLFQFLNHEEDRFGDGKISRCMCVCECVCVNDREREWEINNKKLLDIKKEERNCLTMFSAKPVVNTAEILKTKSTASWKLIWENIPGRGNAEKGRKVGMSWKLLGPKRRAVRTREVKSEAWQRWSRRGRQQQNHAEPFSPGWRIFS